MELKELVSRIIAIYGDWENPEVMKVFLEYIKAEIRLDRLDRFLSAILKSHPSARGAPDVAAAELAIMRAEERGEYLRRPYRATDDWSTSSLPRDASREERDGLQTSKRAAAAMGIDIRREDWFSSYILKECERVARENHRQGQGT